MPVCVLCQGTGATPLAIPERYGYLHDAQPLTPTPTRATAYHTLVLHVTGWSSLGAWEPRDRYTTRQEYRSQQDITEWPDDVLVAYVTRLRRQLVMADEDRLDSWYRDHLQRLYMSAEHEMRWRERAGQRGGGPVQQRGRWTERIEKIKTQLDLVKLIVFENRDARPLTSTSWVCCCPFHQDRSPSLHVDTEKGVWYCHACAVGGDGFTYVQMRYGCTFMEAVVHLEERLSGDGNAA